MCVTEWANVTPVGFPAELPRTFQHPGTKKRKESSPQGNEIQGGVGGRKKKKKKGGEHWLLPNLLLTLGQLICVRKSYCWPASSKRPTETKQCSVYSQYEDSSQNKNNAFKEITSRYFLWVCASACVCVCVCVCVLFESTNSKLA